MNVFFIFFLFYARCLLLLVVVSLVGGELQLYSWEMAIAHYPYNTSFVLVLYKMHAFIIWQFALLAAALLADGAIKSRQPSVSLSKWSTAIKYFARKFVSRITGGQTLKETKLATGVVTYDTRLITLICKTEIASISFAGKNYRYCVRVCLQKFRIISPSHQSPLFYWVCARACVRVCLSPFAVVQAFQILSSFVLIFATARCTHFHTGYLSMRT